MSRLPHKSIADIQKQIKRNEEEGELWDRYNSACGVLGRLVYNHSTNTQEIEAAHKAISEAKAKLEDFTGIRIP